MSPALSGESYPLDPRKAPITYLALFDAGSEPGSIHQVTLFASFVETLVIANQGDCHFLLTLLPVISFPFSSDPFSTLLKSRGLLRNLQWLLGAPLLQEFSTSLSCVVLHLFLHSDLLRPSALTEQVRSLSFKKASAFLPRCLGWTHDPCLGKSSSYAPVGSSYLVFQGQLEF